MYGHFKTSTPLNFLLQFIFIWYIENYKKIIGTYLFNYKTLNLSRYFGIQRHSCRYIMYNP